MWGKIGRRIKEEIIGRKRSRTNKTRMEECLGRPDALRGCKAEVELTKICLGGANVWVPGMTMVVCSVRKSVGGATWRCCLGLVDADQDNSRLEDQKLQGFGAGAVVFVLLSLAFRWGLGAMMRSHRPCM